MDLGNLASLRYFYPELLLMAAALMLVLIDLVLRDKSYLGELALVAVALALLVIGLESHSDEAWLFNRMLVYDPFATFFRVLIVLAALVASWMSIGSDEIKSCEQGEYYAVLIASTLGMLLMAESVNLLMAYLALEFVSLTSYVLTGVVRHNRRSQEAALKYLIYGGVASGLMIYGMSWIFGLAGALDFGAINRALLTNGHAPPLTVFIALVLILAGLGYKIASVPFHMWAPDVYEGAPIPITTFLAVGSKAAGFALLTRFFYPAISRVASDGNWQGLRGVEWPQLLLVICAVTMTLGNLAALQQDNLKRLLAYSSIAQAGYALMGFVLLSNDGIRAMLVYLFAYYVMDAGAFVVVLVVRNATGREDLGAYRGLAARGGAAPAIALAIFLLSLTGIPATVGFIGKFYVFAAAVRQRFFILAVIGILNSVVSLYYYMRPVRAMFLEDPEEGAPPFTGDLWNYGLIGALALATIILGLYPPPVIAFADRSVHFFIGRS
ncbi:MAG TPA: NADH-quinone oxidoreductase subunit N [Candidatus Binataceae bacterium]|nr:NADH-quinone oxidoreductase subunit N [Candidatus Binataceae bacterium]